MTTPRRSISIRAYQFGDAPAMSQLYFDAARTLGLRGYSAEQVAAWAPSPEPADQVHARASDGRTTLVAVDARDEVVAYSDLEIDGHIDHLYCHPNAAGQGVAGRLVDALLHRAITLGCTWATVEASELAKPLFAKVGFEVIERRDFVLRGVNIHNYAMKLRLSLRTGGSRPPAGSR